MGRSPVWILACLSTMSLGADTQLSGTDSANEPPLSGSSIIFDASAYLNRMGSVDASGLPTVNGYVFSGDVTTTIEPVQSVPVAPALAGAATLGVGWIILRGLGQIRRFRRR